MQLRETSCVDLHVHVFVGHLKISSSIFWENIEVKVYENTLSASRSNLLQKTDE